MAYSAFGEQFGETFRQAWESADERDAKEKVRKDKIADQKESEKRVILAAAQAKQTSALKAMAGSATGPFTTALSNLNIPMTKQRAGGVRAAPVEMINEAIGVGQEPISAMDAVRQSMPQGEEGTIENVRAQNEYLARIAAEERRVAGPEESRAAAVAAERNRLAARLAVEDETRALKHREYTADFDLKYSLEAAARTDVENLALAELAGKTGETLAEARITVGEAFPAGSDLFKRYKRGAKVYDRSDEVARFSRNIRLMESDVKKNESVRPNPYDPQYQKDFHDGWEDLYELAQGKQYEDMYAAELQLEADFTRNKGLRKNAMEADLEDIAGMAGAVAAMRKYVDTAFSKSPAGTTTTLFASELGIPEVIATSAHQIWKTRITDEQKHDIYIKHKSGWFDTVSRLNKRLRTAKDLAAFPEVNFRTPLVALNQIELGLEHTEAEGEAGLTGESLKWFNKIGADIGDLGRIPDPKVRKRVENQIYLTMGKVTADQLARSLNNIADFDFLASTLGKPKGIKFFAVRTPDADKRMLLSPVTVDGKSTGQEAAPVNARQVIRPGVVLTRAQKEELKKMQLEESGWVYDDKIGQYVWPPFINRDRGK